MGAYKTLRPLIFLQDPEKAHERVVSLGALCWGTGLSTLLRLFFKYEDPSLKSSFCGIDFENPIGIAAGFDKNGILSEFFEDIGFGFEEAGSVTYLGEDGNPKPRVFRLPHEEAVINRMGLNNLGAAEIARILQGRRNKNFPLIVNIAKTHNPNITGDRAIRDFADSYRLLWDKGNLIVLNVSCPNTLEGKTFEEPEPLRDLLNEIQRIRKEQDNAPSFGIKFSVDLYEFPEMNSSSKVYKLLDACENEGINFYCVGNTSQRRDELANPEIAELIGKGGLSGKPIRARSTELVKIIYSATRKPVIGVGGVSTAQDAYDKIRAGAGLVEVFTGMVYEGPMIAKNINLGLVKLLNRDGFRNVSEAVGADI